MDTITVAKPAIVAAGLIALAACTDVPSEDVLTSGMYADIHVTATGDGNSTVGAVLRVGGPLSTTFVELTGEDDLTATHLEETVSMTPLELGAIHTFTATFDDDTPDEPFVVAFERIIDDGAPDNTMSLPDAFELDALTETEFSRADDALTITWQPSGTSDDMTITFDGDYVLIASFDVSGDPGTYTLEADTLEDAAGDSAQNCEIEYTVQRRRAGSVDTAFGEGGAAYGIQERSGTIASTP